MEGLHVGDPLYFEMKYNAGNGLLREFRSIVSYLTTVEIEEIEDNEGKYLLLAEKDGARKEHISWKKSLRVVLLNYGVDSEENTLMQEIAKWCAESKGYRLKNEKNPIESERR